MLLLTREKVFYSFALIMAWIFFVYVLVNSAWVTEDAFITFRSVLNFVNGYGPVWNIGERVQVFTHPLWFLLLSITKWMTGYLVYAALFLSMFFALASIFILQFLSMRRWIGLTLIIMLATSRAFIEYSSSGLENSLAAFILGSFCWVLFYRPVLWRLVFLASLLALCRMDLILFVLPTLLYSCWYRRKTANQWLFSAILAALPFCTWLLFSLIYYGSFFPNTYYAKLPDGFSHLEFFKQAFNYFQDSATEDPSTLLLIVSGSLIGIIAGDTQVRLLVFGEILYLGYIVWIGGDYMTGRFFMVPAYVGAMLLARCAKLQLWIFALLTCLSIVLSLQTKAPIMSNIVPKTNFIAFSSLNIINERANWWPQNSWLGKESTLHAAEALGNNWHYTGSSCAIPMLAVGGAGLTAGPNIHIVDFLGITDPLLARLPASNFFPGHFSRKVPKGYMSSLNTGNNVIADPKVAALYERVREIVKGPLWTARRWHYIMDLLGGKWRGSVARYDQNGELTTEVPAAFLMSSHWAQLLNRSVLAENNVEIAAARRDICLEQWDYQ
ncbi:MAG TPA: hypothetical protein VGK97_03530 [Spongiibacteraceae bacterium]|jgi:arabinofuranosyltransferase